MKDYHVNVFHSDDDACYVADIPDLRFCSAFGDTPEEAMREVQKAKAPGSASPKIAARQFQSQSTGQPFIKSHDNQIAATDRQIDRIVKSTLACAAG